MQLKYAWRAGMGGSVIINATEERSEGGVARTIERELTIRQSFTTETSGRDLQVRFKAPSLSVRYGAGEGANRTVLELVVADINVDSKGQFAGIVDADRFRQ